MPALRSNSSSGSTRRSPERATLGRERLGRPLTLTEKILINHLVDPHGQEIERGASYNDFNPDRVAMQDATAQMALLQFMTAGLPEVAVPSTVHCDHLIQAKVGAPIDLGVAVDTNREVYDFLKSVSAKYQIGFWGPGSGIIHQVVLENYAFPGGMMIGTDSHTPNAGGLGMVAIGVGGADAVDVMTGFPFNVRWPKVIGVKLTGSLSGWSSPKDVILEVARVLTVEGGTGSIVEYFGPGADTISATGKATICNMGAEIGATTSLFGYDHNMSMYLKATGREAIADAADKVVDELRPDDGATYDQLIEIDLDRVEAVDQRTRTPPTAPIASVASVGDAARENDWPLEISSALVGSCTNSSYEDITRAASIARQASAHGLKSKVELLVTPGSEQIRATIERDGLLADLEAIGATVLANACGPCIGQWSRPASITGRPNTIVNSYNRNFPKRNDGSASTLAFVTSPDTVVALALAGTLDFDPTTQPIVADDGTEVMLEPPVGEVLPSRGYDPGENTFTPPPPIGDRGGGRGQPDERPPAAARAVPRVGRQRLRRPARPDEGSGQVHHRPHLGRRSVAQVPRPPREHLRQPVPRRGQRVHGSRRRGQGPASTVPRERSPTSPSTTAKPGIAWCAVGDRNYGEGSSREHAAMEPRFRNGRVIFARSFARIHETNAKKQGLLPLTFSDPATYDAIGEDDRINVLGLPPVPGQPVRCQIVKPDGSIVDFECSHTFSDEQVDWFRAGSALNIVRAQGGGGRVTIEPRDTVNEMDLITALRTTGAARRFTDEPVDRATVAAILDDARFAPSGGNRQPWRVAVVEDQLLRRQLAALMQPVWDEYLAAAATGQTPFNTVAFDPPAMIAAGQPNELLERIEQVPVVLVVAADLAKIAADGRAARPLRRSRAAPPSTRSAGASCWRHVTAGSVA